jgi:hypothetical protein
MNTEKKCLAGEPIQWHSIVAPKKTFEKDFCGSVWRDKKKLRPRKGVKTFSPPPPPKRVQADDHRWLDLTPSPLAAFHPKAHRIVVASTCTTASVCAKREENCAKGIARHQHSRRGILFGPENNKKHTKQSSLSKRETAQQKKII